MAVTGIWKIEGRLDKVLDYTTNENKTYNDNFGNYQALHNVIDYVGAEYKTEQQFFVSGINCSKETALEDMIITKKQYGKTDGIQAFHVIQSFNDGEVTPELCHKIGVQLAEELFGNRFEVIISTHLNTNHYHNHIVLNSVSFKDGKRYYDNNTTYALIRKTSDLICEENNLSVIQDKKVKIDYTKFYEGRVTQSNYYTTTKADIDFAIKQAYSYQDFINLLKRMNYEVFFRANKISVRREPYKRNIRIERAFGDKYSITNIQKRVIEEHETRTPFIELRSNKKIYRCKKSFTENYKKNKQTGIQSLMLNYYYLFKIYSKVYPKKYISPQLRADIKKLKIRLNQANWLCENKISYVSQLISYKEKLSEELVNLKSRREDCYILKKRKNNLDKNKIQEEISVLTDKINYLRNEVRMAEEIEKTIPMIKENLKTLNEKNNERSIEKDVKFK